MKEKNNVILERLRVLWRNKESAEFHRLYGLSKWMLDKEDVDKIEKALGHNIKTMSKGEQQDLIKYALEIMPGSKIVESDNVSTDNNLDVINR